MPRALTFLHPDDWYASVPPRRWDHVSRTWTFRPSLAKPKEVADAYQGHIFSALLSEALRLLNAHARRDDDGEPYFTVPLDALPEALEHRAIRAGAAVGVRFTPGRSLARHMIRDAHLSREWLARASRNASRLALDYWDAGVTRTASDRGSRSKRRPVHTHADLIPGSIKSQAEALGVSRSTIARLRRQQKEAGL